MTMIPGARSQQAIQRAIHPKRGHTMNKAAHQPDELLCRDVLKGAL